MLPTSIRSAMVKTFKDLGMVVHVTVRCVRVDLNYFCLKVFLPVQHLLILYITYTYVKFVFNEIKKLNVIIKI